MLESLGGFATSAQAAGFQLKPTASAYAKAFIQQSEGQQWFIEEVERLLNIQEKSLNTIQSQEDLNQILTLGLYNKEQELSPISGLSSCFN